MVDLPVSVLGLADAAVGEGVACMIGIHAEVEVVTGVGHGELERERFFNHGNRNRNLLESLHPPKKRSQLPG